MRWCRGCRTHRHHVLPYRETCKGSRLCTEIDVFTADLLCQTRNCAGIPLDELRAIKTAQLEGFMAASTWARFARYPADPEDFAEFLTTLHGLLFKNTDLPFAGRLRRPGEPVFFGREWRTVEGEPAERIRWCLIDLHRQVWKPRPSQLSQDDLIRDSARFLHLFFLIHPFSDGNGRIARLILTIVARETHRFSFQPFETSENKRKNQRRYLTALRFADTHIPYYGAKQGARANPYHPLRTWIKQFIKEEREDQDDEDTDQSE